MKKIQRNTMRFLAVMMLLITPGLYGQTLNVKGKVTDASTGEALVGASIMEKGTSNAVVTDYDGQYSIQVKKGSVLVFSYIGYTMKEIKVYREEIHVVLEEDRATLDEVVVVSTKSRKLFGRSEKRMQSEVAAPAPAYITETVQSTTDNLLYYPPSPHRESSNEEFNGIIENRFRPAIEEPLSTFSVDVDVASYSNMRRYINNGQLSPADAIRTEELINYFSYDYKKPTGSDPVNISTEVGSCPWNSNHRLVKIGIKAKEIAGNELPPSNLVFLIDVSGSMWGPTRLDLVKSSLKLLVNNLREQDRVAIVVYAGSAGEVLPSTSGNDKQKIREALDQLTAGGSTAGGAGIQLAYKIAEQNFMKNGNNRIILCTDGDFNVGVSSKDGLEKLIEEKRKTGVFLTVLGYGMGNYKDNRMQVLAEKGNGNYAYIDNLQEANKVLVTEFGGTLYTVAKDVKLQIEFNPAHVQAYRLIGYESRLLNKEDFNDDTKDAGEMGAGHTVTAFYEVVPTGVESNFTGSVDKLKYQQQKQTKPVLNASPELLTVKLRYKRPEEDVSKKIEVPLMDKKGINVSPDFRFAASVAMFGQLIRKSDFAGDATYDKVIALAESALDNDALGYRREFIRMVNTVKGMAQ